VKLTLKSRLKSQLLDAARLKCRPMRRRKRSNLACGAHDIAMIQVQGHAVGVLCHE
jgi:hypothetical protein